MTESTDIAELRNYVHFVVDRHFDPRLASKMDHSDVVQAVMLKACQRKNEFRGESAATFRSWLRKIVLSTVADCARMYSSSRRRVSREVAAISLAEVQGEGTTPSQRAICNEELKQLDQLLSELPQDQQSAFILKFVHGMAVSQIAERMDKSERSVASLIYRAMSSLRQRVESSQSSISNERVNLQG